MNCLFVELQYNHPRTYRGDKNACKLLSDICHIHPYLDAFFLKICLDVTVLNLYIKTTFKTFIYSLIMSILNLNAFYFLMLSYLESYISEKSKAIKYFHELFTTPIYVIISVPMHSLFFPRLPHMNPLHLIYGLLTSI